MKFRYEPARMVAAVSAGVALLVAYGYLDEGRAQLWVALFLAVLYIAQGEATRALVTPTAKLRDAGVHPEDVNASAELHNERTGT